MALYNGRILMRRGLEADFDASKLMSGEWALSTDEGIIRICLEAGTVIRMATYEAFEEDMMQIEAILLECQSIEEAVTRINAEIDTKVDAVVDYVGQAKTYRDEAESFRDEAEQFRDEAESFKNQAGEIVGIGIATNEKVGLVKPDGTTITIDEDGTISSTASGGTEDYTDLNNKPSINGIELSGNKTLEDLGIASAEELEKTNIKLDTIIEKADLGIKETASGEKIHLTDSAEGKAVEFALYGKATQDGEPTPENPIEIELSGESYNLLDNTATSQTINGVEFVVNEDKSVTANGTASADTSFPIVITNLEKGKEYKISTGLKNSTSTTYFIRLGKRTSDVDSWGNEPLICLDNEYTFIADSDYGYVANLRVMNGVAVNNLTFYPMIRKASVKNDRYMPYGKGSVEVKSVGKNLVSDDWEQGILSTTDGKTVSTNNYWVYTSKYVKVDNSKKYTFSCDTPCQAVAYLYDENKTFLSYIQPMRSNSSVVVTLPNSTKYVRFGYNYSGASETITPEQMGVLHWLQLEIGNATEYQPYKETLSTIQTENGLAGIKVSSGGNYTDQNGQQWICDEIVKYADGSGEYVQRCINIVNENMVIKRSNLSTENYLVVWVDSTGKPLKQIAISTHFLQQFSTTPLGISSCIFIAGNSSPTHISIPTSIASDVNNLKTWLLDNNAKIYYPLAEPITTPLTAEELAEISTFYPVTNISNDFDCGMKVKYNCDSKNYIDNKIALLTTAMVNSI